MTGATSPAWRGRTARRGRSRRAPLSVAATVPLIGTQPTRRTPGHSAAGAGPPGAAQGGVAGGAIAPEGALSSVQQLKPRCAHGFFLQFERAWTCKSSTSPRWRKAVFAGMKPQPADCRRA